MKLKYRGVNYEYNPPQVAVKPTGVVGIYRGMEWRFRAVSPGSIHQPTLNLLYRGVAYQTGQPAPIPATGVTSPVVKVSRAGASARDMARVLMLGHHALIKRRQQSMLGRVASEVGL